MLNSRDLAQLLLLYVILSTVLFGLSFTLSSGEENYTRTIRFWTSFGAKQVEVSYTIPCSKFEYYYNAPHLQAVQNGEMHFSYYVVSDSVASGLAETLRSMADGEEDVADTVLSFVQNAVNDTGYSRDNTLYPIETLVLGGVCDDLSVLYATMMWSLGYRLIFVYHTTTSPQPGIPHLSVGIQLASPPLHYTTGKCVHFDVNGTRYYAAEPAGKGWMVGDGPWSQEDIRFEQVVAHSHVYKYPTAIWCDSNLTAPSRFGLPNMTAELGHSVLISGTIQCAYKMTAVNSPVPVKLTFVFPGEVDLTKTVETGSRWRLPWLAGVPEKIATDLPVDQYEVLFVPDRAGKWFVYSSWDGDDYMEGARSDTISFIITSPASWPILKVFANRDGVPLVLTFETTSISIVLSTSTTTPEVIPVKSGSTIRLQVGIQTVETTRYVFDRWGDGDMSNPRTITVFGDMSLTMIIKTQYYLSLKNNLAGSVQTHRNEGWYDAGSTLTIIPDSLSSYKFESWTVDGEHKEGDRLTIAIDKPYVVVLNYEPSGPVLTPSTPQPPPSCLIATATYGSELSPEVQLLREFRDQQVMQTSAGREFMIAFNACYYSFSPNIAEAIAENPSIKAVFRILLYPLIGILWFSARTYSMFNFNPELAVVTAGLVASSLIGAIYFSPLTVLVLWMQAKSKKALPMRHWKSLAIIWTASLILILVGEALLIQMAMMVGTSMFVLTTLGLSAMAVGTRIFQIKHEIHCVRKCSWPTRSYSLR